MFALYLCQVPFLDICNTMLDPSLPLTKLDYEEFGNPQIQSQFEYIRSYSPYDNIPSGVCHPSVLVTASFHDARQNHILCFLLFINTWTCIFYLVFYTCPYICLYQACKRLLHRITCIDRNYHWLSSGLESGKLPNGWPKYVIECALLVLIRLFWRQIRPEDILVKVAAIVNVRKLLMIMLFWWKFVGTELKAWVTLVEESCFRHSAKS